MLNLQRKLHRDYHTVINDLIRQIKASPEHESHKKYKINVLKVTAQLRDKLDEQKRKQIDNFTDYPSLVFGYYEFQYLGNCPFCDHHLLLAWCGDDSLKRSVRIAQKKSNEKSSFKCKSCKTEIVAEHHVWLCAIDKTYILVTICKKCNTEQRYPYKLIPDPLIVESGGPHSKIQNKDIPEWMLPRQTFYMNGKLFGFLDTQVHTVIRNKLQADFMGEYISELDKIDTQFKVE